MYGWDGSVSRAVVREEEALDWEELEGFASGKVRVEGP